MIWNAASALIRRSSFTPKQCQTLNSLRTARIRPPGSQRAALNCPPCIDTPGRTPAQLDGVHVATSTQVSTIGNERASASVTVRLLAPPSFHRVGALCFAYGFSFQRTGSPRATCSRASRASGKRTPGGLHRRSGGSFPFPIHPPRYRVVAIDSGGHGDSQGSASGRNRRHRPLVRWLKSS